MQVSSTTGPGASGSRPPDSKVAEPKSMTRTLLLVGSRLASLQWKAVAVAEGVV